MNKYIYGVHDPPPDDWLRTYLMNGDEARGWIVFTEELGADPTDLSSRDYSHWADMGFGIIARLNHGYYPNGTIPAPDKWQDFVLRVKNFVKGSKGCKRWIIGNETNMRWEWPQEQVITAERYATLFSDARVGIHEVRPLDFVIPGAVAPWNVDAGDWLEYLEDVLYYCDLYGGFDAVCLHIYTHGSDPRLITSPQTMDPPYQDRYFHFQHYKQMIDRIPPQCRGLPVYITETNENIPEDGWLDEPNTWIQEMYREIDSWNQTEEPKIHCVCLYCWDMRGDMQYIQGKSSVYQDLALAVAKAYTNGLEEKPPVEENWSIVYENHCNDYYDQDGEPEVTVPVGYHVEWVGVRPEMDRKYTPQPEVFPEDPPYSGVGFHVYNTFDWTLISSQPVSVAAGKRTKLEVALMVIAHGFDDDPDKLGDCGMQIGVGEPGGVQYWSEWQAVRDGPGGNLNQGEWVVVETPEFVPTVGQVEVYIRCVANVPAAISAGHYDRIRIWQEDGGSPPPAGEYVVVVYDPNGAEVARCSFPAVGSDPQICALAQEIVALSCGG